MYNIIMIAMDKSYPMDDVECFLPTYVLHILNNCTQENEWLPTKLSQPSLSKYTIDQEYFFQYCYLQVLHSSSILIRHVHMECYKYSLVERGTVKEKCSAQQHNTKISGKAWNWTVQSVVGHTS